MGIIQFTVISLLIETIKESIKNDFNPNKPIFEFVVNYNAGTLTRYIGR